MSAEAVAMIWTLAWISQMPFQVPAFIYYDNNTIGKFISGQQSWNASWEFAKLHSALSSLRQCLQTVGRLLHCVHQKSHTNHPWSDLVDAAAKAAAKRILLQPSLPSQVAECLNRVAFRFAWLALVPSTEVPKPAALSGTLKAEGPFGSYPVDFHWDNDTSQATDFAVTIQLKFVTANVLTLQSGPKNRQLGGLFEKGRVASLQAQFSRQGYHLVGLQECRTQGQFMRHSASHLSFQSGATSDGARGCELWVDRNAPYAIAKNAKFFFQTSHFHVAAFSDRFLLVVIRAPHLHFRVLVIHAPHEHAVDVSLPA